MTYEMIVDYLFNLPRFTKGGHMDNVRKLLTALGNPQDHFKYIHVAGTNGKGSVCAYMAGALQLAGKRVGLFTSPHLIRVNERIQVSGRMISDADFTRLFFLIRDRAAQTVGCEEPTFFEYIYLMAMVYFSEQHVEYGVIETGLGGRMDFTNVIKQPVLTILTSISMDHMNVLGDTIEQIADEKAGIIKAQTPLVYDGRDARARAVIEAYVSRLDVKATAFDASLAKIIADDGKNIDFLLDCGYHDKCRFTLSTAAAYQIVNAALAFMGLQQLWQAGLLSLPEHTDRALYNLTYEAFSHTRWPGRMEEVAERFFVDGAHNEAGIEAFVESARRGFGDTPLYLVFAVAGDKDYPVMIRKLCQIPALKGVVVTEIENGRRCDLLQTQKVFQENWHGNICSTYNIKEALKLGLDMRGDDGILCCVGSLYLVGSILEEFV